MGNDNHTIKAIDGFGQNDYEEIAKLRQQTHNLIDTLDPDDQLKFFIREFRDFSSALHQTDDGFEEIELISYMEVLASRMVEIEDNKEHLLRKRLDSHITEEYRANIRHENSDRHECQENTEDILDQFLNGLGYVDEEDMDPSTYC